MSARLAAPALPVALPPLSRLLVAVAIGLARWDDRRKIRAALRRLDTHLLQDIGLDPAFAAAECVKPFWQD